MNFDDQELYQLGGFFQQILAAEISIVLFNHPSRKVFLIAHIESNQKFTPTFLQIYQAAV